MPRGKNIAVDVNCPACGAPTQRIKTFDQFCADFTLTPIERRELIEYLGEYRRRRTVHVLTCANDPENVQNDANAARLQG